MSFRQAGDSLREPQTKIMKTFDSVCAAITLPIRLTTSTDFSPPHTNSNQRYDGMCGCRLFRETRAAAAFTDTRADESDQSRCVIAADLIPEITHEENAHLNIVHFLAFLFGVGLLWVVRLAFED
jgi:hypothetical protein